MYAVTEGPDSSAGLVFTRRTLWAVFIAVSLIGLSFALYTGHAWEDYWITYRVAKNLAAGNGMVYTVGERVHAFTSPLGTLLPAFLGLVTGNRSDELVLWLFRLLGCGLLGLTAVLLLRIARATGMSLFPAVLMVGLFAFDAKTVDFSINGMETAFMVFFLTASLHVLMAPTGRFVARLGLAWAGMMWTRPDSFIYIGGLALGVLLFKPDLPHFSSRKEMAKKFVFAGAVTAACYLPWVLWAWHYFGSPVPHTVVAKGLFMPGPDITLPARLAGFFFTGFRGSVVDTFLPAGYVFGGWPDWVIYAGALPALLGFYYWCFPFGRPEGRAVSFAFFLAHFYLTSIEGYTPANGWYIPSATLLAVFCIGQIAFQAFEKADLLRNRARAGAAGLMQAVVYVFGAALVVGALSLTTAAGYGLRLQQRTIEDSNRRPIGLWLKEHAASPKDRVFLECLGYIGFYSQLKMLDFPGLSSPEVVHARRMLQTNAFAPLILSLQPDWLVLRPHEIDAIQEQMPSLLPDYYNQVRVFDVSEKVGSHPYLPGRPMLEFDQVFVIFRMKNAGEVTGQP